MTIKKYIKLLCCAIFPVMIGWGPAHGAGDFDRAFQAAASGDLNRAVILWSKAIEKNPKSYASHLNRGTAHLRNGFVYRAITDWHKARELSPIFAYATCPEDFILEASGNTLLLNFVKSIELDPDYVASVLMTGCLYSELGKSATAVDLYRKSLDLTKNPLLKSFLDHWINSLTDGKQPATR